MENQSDGFLAMRCDLHRLPPSEEPKTNPSWIFKPPQKTEQHDHEKGHMCSNGQPTVTPFSLDDSQYFIANSSC